MSHLLEIDENNFRKEVDESAVPVLIYFQSEWCPACKGLSPVIEAMAGRYEGKVRFIKVDVMKNQKIAVDHTVLSTPALIFFKDGKEIFRNLGFVTESSLRALIEKYL